MVLPFHFQVDVSQILCNSHTPDAGVNFELFILAAWMTLPDSAVLNYDLIQFRCTLEVVLNH